MRASRAGFAASQPTGLGGNTNLFIHSPDEAMQSSANKKTNTYRYVYLNVFMYILLYVLFLLGLALATLSEVLEAMIANPSKIV